MTTPSALRVIQISDLHIHAEPDQVLWGTNVDQGLAAVLRRVRECHWPAEFVLATGDLVHEEREPGYERLQWLLAPLGVPVYCLPGNHDEAAALQQVLTGGPVRRERLISVGNWQFLLLDSSVPGSAGGHLAVGELQFLEQSLAAHPDLYTVVCLHHQPVPVGSAWLDTMRVDNHAEFFAILDRHPRVRAVIWGHIHQVFESRRGNVDLLGAPSTCAQLAPQLAEMAVDTLAPGYRWFELEADGSLRTGVERARWHDGA